MLPLRHGRASGHERCRPTGLPLDRCGQQRGAGGRWRRRARTCGGRHRPRQHRGRCAAHADEIPQLLRHHLLRLGRWRGRHLDHVPYPPEQLFVPTQDIGHEGLPRARFRGYIDRRCAVAVLGGYGQPPRWQWRLCFLLATLVRQLLHMDGRSSTAVPDTRVRRATLVGTVAEHLARSLQLPGSSLQALIKQDMVDVVLLNAQPEGDHTTAGRLAWVAEALPLLVLGLGRCHDDLGGSGGAELVVGEVQLREGTRRAHDEVSDGTAPLEAVVVELQHVHSHPAFRESAQQSSHSIGREPVLGKVHLLGCDGLSRAATRPNKVTPEPFAPAPHLGVQHAPTTHGYSDLLLAFVKKHVGLPSRRRATGLSSSSRRWLQGVTIDTGLCRRLPGLSRLL
mmetsp:Transcript_101631/g.217616  ORF Transcript_101631/g.217616 Transcript_101631/m.217616 type:complete len:395 (-) Transcript_101631:110-1294(-)